VKLVGRESLLHEKEAKKVAEAAKAAKKERKKAEKAAVRDAQKKINPQEMFLSETDKYSKFDDKVWNFVSVVVIYNLCSILVILATVFT